MALTKLNNRSISAVTTLPSASTSSFLTDFSTLSSTDMPAGSVLQVIELVPSDLNPLTVSGSTMSTNFITGNITTRANSKLLFQFWISQLDKSQGATNPAWEYYIDGSEVMDRDKVNHSMYDDGNTADGLRPVITHVWMSDALSAGTHAIRVDVGNHDANSWIIWNYQSNGSQGRWCHLFVSEIAG